jgi:hypothetical protein
MRSTIRTRTVAVLCGATFLLLAPIGMASAHVGTSVGHIDMETGFINEPAYVGELNGVALILMHDGKPVKDLGDAVTVQVSFGDQTSEPQTLEPWFFYEDGKLESGNPGEYHYYFIPSQPGPYTFHFQGTLDGEKIDESFTSGPKTFDEVADPVTAAFPQVTAPTNEELATRVDQEATRTDGAITQAEAAASDAQSAADSARTMAMLGLLVGTIGVIAAVIALVTRKRA